MYDYLIVGAGLYGSVFAREATDRGYKCLVIDKRGHIGGNVYTERIEGINVHKYGAHIFHTNNKRVWEYLSRFTTFNRFTNSPVANYKGELYSLPFNMYTFNKMWGVVTPEEAKKKIEEQRKEYINTRQNIYMTLENLKYKLKWHMDRWSENMEKQKKIDAICRVYGEADYNNLDERTDA